MRMSDEQCQLLGGISPAEFLQTYWQKKPYLIRQAISCSSPFISVDELFQLARDQYVESRLVIEKGGDYPWQVLPGPMDDSTYTNLPDSHWSLLVQGVNFHNKQAALLLKRFSFIPNWRIDDLMVSYACKEGSVGPHLDSYDVFLLQSFGKRRWYISSDRYMDQDFLNGTDLRIIANFNSDQEWDLNPGDMLYLPPGVAHHGIALDECMTCSIGFRAPTRHELLTGYLERIYDPETDTQYRDPDMQVQEQAGEIRMEDLLKIRKIMHSSLENSRDIDRWFGSYITSVPAENIHETPLEFTDQKGFSYFISTKPCFRLHHASRTAFLRAGEGLLLFVNGREYPLSGNCLELVSNITGTGIVDCSEMDQIVLSECTEVLLDLYNKGEMFNVQ